MAAFAGVVAWLIGAGMGHAEWVRILVAIGAVAIVAVAMIYRLKPPPGDDEPNIFIDSGGLWWKDNEAGELARAAMTGFRIGIDEELEFAAPMVAFQLIGDWESQPLAIHEPASPEALRKFLLEDLELPELRPGEDELRAGIYRAVNNGLIDCEDSILTRFAARWMRVNLIEPQPHGDNQWLIARIDQLGDILYHDLDCDYTIVSKDDTESFYRLPELVEAITDRAPVNEERTAIARRADEEIEAREKEMFLADVAEAGFLAECFDRDQTWLFEGTREGLLKLPKAMELAAAEMRSPPDYARPEQLTLGGSVMGVTIEKADWSYIGSRRITGTTERLKLLARHMREKIESAKPGEKVFYEPPHDASGKWRFRFLVREQNFPKLEVHRTPLD